MFLYKGAFDLDERFLRNEMLIGKENQKKLYNSNVVIFGVGGVGSYVAEGLARSGVGNITLVDSDCVDITNINRQIHAVSKTVGRPKTEVMKERIVRYCDKLSAMPKLRKMYENCYTSTWLTALQPCEDGTYFVLTGDIPAMWLRDSAAQVTHYIPLAQDAEVAAVELGGVCRPQGLGVDGRDQRMAVVFLECG